MIYAFFLFVFVQKSFLTKNCFLTAEINLTIRGPLYTCLVLKWSSFPFIELNTSLDFGTHAFFHAFSKTAGLEKSYGASLNFCTSIFRGSFGSEGEVTSFVNSKLTVIQ